MPIIKISDFKRLLLASIGIISDPTTKGVQDSKLAISYDAPKSDQTE
ncbi:MAG: phage holin [Acutalibacteraceae bacterium]